MERLYRVLLILLIVTSLVVACGGAATPAPQTAPQTAPTEAANTEEAAPTEAPSTEAVATAAPEAPSGSGGTLIVAVPATPTGYPILQAAGLGDNVVGKFLTEGLTRYAKDSLTPEPALATEWSSNETGTEWTFTLREGVTWHDGEPFTAEDVKFTFDLIMNPDVPARGRGQVASLQSVEILDDYTVKMTFETPIVDLPVMLAYNMGILPKHILEGLDPNAPQAFLDHPIGTGSFMFEESVSGSHWTMVKNPNWWGGEVLLDRLVLKVVPDINATLAQLKAGDIHVALIQPQQAATLENDPNVMVSAVPQVNYFYLSLINNTEPFDNVNVRRALNYAVDKEALIQTVLRGYGEIATGPISPIIEWAYSDDVTRYPYDPEKAKEMLAAEGWTDSDGDGFLDKDGEPFTIELTTSEGVINGPQLAEILKQYLEQIGVQSTINLVEFSELWVGLFDGQFQSSVEYLAGPPTPDLYNDLGCEGGRNRFFYCNEEADDLLLQAGSTVDQATRAELYAQFQKAVTDNPPGIYLYYPQELRAINKQVQGFPNLPFREAFMHIDDVSIAN